MLGNEARRSRPMPDGFEAAHGVIRMWAWDRTVTPCLIA